MTLQNHSIFVPCFNSPVAASTQPDAGLGSLFEKQPIEKFEAGESVFFEGDPARHVFKIEEGVIRLCKILLDGRRVICGFLFAGDIIGVSQRQRFIYAAEAVNAVKLRRLPRRGLEEALDKSSKLRPQIFARICDEMNVLQQHMVLLSCKSAEERVSSFVANLMKRQAVPGERPVLIDLPMTRQDIADHLGMTIETVSRNLTKLARQGVLADVERFSLRVIKPGLLCELSGVWVDDEDEDEFEMATARVAPH